MDWYWVPHGPKLRSTTLRFTLDKSPPAGGARDHGGGHPAPRHHHALELQLKLSSGTPFPSVWLGGPLRARPRADAFLRKLRQSRLDNSPDGLMAELIAIDLLVIDDFALEPMTSDGSRDVHQLFVEPTGRASTVVTSNHDTAEWLTTFDDTLLAQSVIRWSQVDLRIGAINLSAEDTKTNFARHASSTS